MSSYMLPKKKEDSNKPIEVPSLVHLCSQKIRDSIHLNFINHALSFVPNELLELLLDGCPPEQLIKIESYAQRDLSYVTEDLWRFHCRKFLNDNDIDDKGGAASWKEFYEDLIVQYEMKKIETGKNLRRMYESNAKEKASKKIKVLDSAPVARARTQTKFGTVYTGYTKSVSKPMEKCLKDMRKTQAVWRKPIQAPIQNTLIKPSTSNWKPIPSSQSNLQKPSSTLKNSSSSITNKSTHNNSMIITPKSTPNSSRPASSSFVSKSPLSITPKSSTTTTNNTTSFSKSPISKPPLQTTSNSNFKSNSNSNNKPASVVKSIPPKSNPPSFSPYSSFSSPSSKAPSHSQSTPSNNRKRPNPF